MKLLNTAGLRTAQNVMPCKSNLFRKVMIMGLWFFKKCPWKNCLNNLFPGQIQTVVWMKTYVTLAGNLFTQKCFLHFQHPNLNETSKSNKGY